MLSILATGGTIACTHDEHGALVPTVSAQELAKQAGLPSARAEDVFSVDSSSITLAELDTIVSRVNAELLDNSVSAVILTHGTDSLEETALALDIFHNSEKPVVVTGAQLPFDDPAPDGPRNLAQAAKAAASLPAGVHVVFGGRIMPARGVRKTHTSSLAGFENPTTYVQRRAGHAPMEGIDVPIISAYPGCPGWVVDAAVDRGARGIVLEALGSGNVPVAVGHAASRALEAGVPVCIATRVPFGSVSLSYGGSGGGATLADRGALSAGELSAGQARIALIAALATGMEPSALLQ